ncbi:MAG: thioredoxin-disulfide reductase [bacterium]|nr:thioredoxin-disulfide reductase [bacterium]
MEKRDVIIIGSGPAGLTAAIYTARANLEPLVFEGLKAGGQLMITTEVENYPGFSEGINGPELMEELKAQAERFGAELEPEDVTKVELSKDKKIVWTEDDAYEAETVIISTGATANLLGLENETRLMGRGVSACATCDGFFFKDKIICVVGGGDSAMEEATYLTRFASKVYLIHRRDQFRASKIMVKTAEENPKIEFVLNSVPLDILGEDRVTAIKLKNTKTGEISDLEVNGVFMAIGHTPSTELFKGQLNMNEKGYLFTSENKNQLTATNIPGVFACGDVQDSNYRQAITAAGSGCMAALDAERYLEDPVHLYDVRK